MKINPKKINTEDLNDVVSLGRRILSILYFTLILGCVIGIGMFCKSFGIFRFISTLLKVLSPFFIGFVLAWLFNPLIIKLRKRVFNKYIATICVYFLFVLFIILFFKIFIPVMYNQVNSFVKMVPNIVASISEYITNFFNNFSSGGLDLTSTKDTMLANLSMAGTNMTTDLPNVIVDFVVKLFSGVGTFAMGIVIGMYMSFDFDDITNLFIKIIPIKYQKDTLTLLDSIGIEVRKTVNGTLLVACMVLICDTVGFSIIGLDGALLFGLFCGITDLIPYIGPYIGAGVAGIVGFTQGPIIGIGVLVIALVVQMIENYVLQPVVMSKATQMHPIVIILGLLLFGHFFGIIGMVFATPILSIFKVIIKYFINKYTVFELKLDSNLELD